MDRNRLTSIAINVLGGIAVLGSYALGIATHDRPGDALWGGVPTWLRPVYQASMLAATAGYLAFTYVVILRADGRQARIGRWGYGLFNAIYLLILIPAALWMPLTFSYLSAPSSAGWAAVRGVLLLTGTGALAMLGAVTALKPRPPSRWLGILGAAAFAAHTGLLDALVWPALFQK